MHLQPVQSENSVFCHWQRFTVNHSRIAPEVREVVYRSWLRCREATVPPDGNEQHRYIEGEDLLAALQARQKLLDVARPFMADLYSLVRGTGFVVVLANERGYILELFGDEDAIETPLTANFFVGASWHERDAGTNAIGTAIIEQSPVQITGAEHFCRIHHRLTCSAAPIVDPLGNLIGVLDISGARKSAHLHTLGMVVAAAKAITAQLRITRQNDQLALANRKLVNFFNMVSDGVLVLDQYGNVAELNPAAEKIFRRKRSELAGLPMQSLLHRSTDLPQKHQEPDWYRSHAEMELTLETAINPCRCLATTEPIVNEQGTFSGSFITLRPIQAVQNLVHRFSGYSASLQFSDIIARSPEMQEVVELAQLSARSSSNVLLQGESGTGKEIFAQAIHNSSSRSAAPFIPLNCGAIPRELVGSELFGYEDGAFTGAKKGGKPGKFELASGGTLFLDEIGDMPMDQQAVLLRVIQEKRMTRIGGLKEIPVDVRLICATHKNLQEKVANGTFRQDLFYRLNVMTITIPPLRERKEDIPPLFGYFIDRLQRDRGERSSFDPDILPRLSGYQWPGNVRELQNVAERAVNLAAGGRVGFAELPEEVNGTMPSPAAAAGPPTTTLLAKSREQQRRRRETREKQQLLALLEQNSGNVSGVARELGVSRKTVYNRMHRLQITC